jgi:hypothetical protein
MTASATRATNAEIIGHGQFATDATMVVITITKIPVVV